MKCIIVSCVQNNLTVISIVKIAYLKDLTFILLLSRIQKDWRNCLKLNDILQNDSRNSICMLVMSISRKQNLWFILRKIWAEDSKNTSNEVFFIMNYLLEWVYVIKFSNIVLSLLLTYSDKKRKLINGLDKDFYHSKINIIAVFSPLKSDAKLENSK